MENRKLPILFLMIACLGVSLMSNAKVHHGVPADSTPVTIDARTIVSNYIMAIGGIDAVRKINSINSTGTFSVQGMALPVTQKRLLPNKTFQAVSMNGTTVAKTVFNGTKGYEEQMGNRTDMTEEEMADMKTQTAIIPQVDYITNRRLQAVAAGHRKSGGRQCLQSACNHAIGQRGYGIL